MYKRYLVIFAVMWFMIVWTASAMALGLGGYMTVGGGDSAYNYSKFEYFTSKNIKDSSNVAIGGGFVMDSNAAYNRVFNYRLKIGGEQNTVEREAEMKLSRFHLQNAFGFGVARTKWVRFWLGPTVGGSYTWGDRDNERYYYGILTASPAYQIVILGGYSPLLFWVDIMRDKITKITYGGIDAGFVLGLNINIGDYVTLGPELGFKYAFNWGSQNREIYWFLPISIPCIIPLNLGDTKNKLKLNGFEIYMNFSVMARVGGDNFAK